MKKIGTYTLRGLKILLGLLLLLYLLVWGYVSLHKKEILQQVNEQVSAKLNGEVIIGEMELSFFRRFPKVSVLMKQVTVKDSLFNQHQHAFFKAEEVFVSLSITRLIRKQPAVNGIRMQKGQVYLYTDSSGYSNGYLLKPSATDSAARPGKQDQSELSSIDLVHMQVTLEDKRKNKLYDFYINKLKLNIRDKGQQADLEASADILVKSLAFKLSRGSFLTGKHFRGHFELHIDKLARQLFFEDIRAKLENQVFVFSGRFDLAGERPQFNLAVDTRKVSYQFLQAILTKKIAVALSRVSLDKPVDASARLSGPLKDGQPMVNILFSVKNSRMTTPFLDFDNAGFSGSFSNEMVKGLPRVDSNSVIVLTNLQASWRGLPVRSNSIRIANLSNPTLSCDLNASFPLQELNQVIGSNVIQLQSGQGDVLLTYQGPVERNNQTNSFINGGVSFKNATVLYAPRNVQLKNVNGNILFKNSDLFIRDLHAEVFNNKIKMEGNAKNLLTLINTEPNKVSTSWTISSPLLNLESFTYLLKSRDKVSASRNNKNQVSEIANKIDGILDKGRLEVNLRLNRLLYKKFEAANVIANLTLLEDRYEINNVSMQHAGGNMNLNGTLIHQAGGLHQAKVHVGMDRVDVKKVFAAFNDFGQDAISAQNLEGKLSTSVDASLLLDGTGKVLPSSLSGIVDFSLKEGALNNFEPIKKMQVFVFKNRDFDNIRFAEIRDRLEIKNREILIHKMEIQSSVMSLFVEGLYSTKGNTDISIQVPLSNLKKRATDYNPENIGVKAKKGSSIFLRGRPGPDGNIQFKLDLFNKFSKDK